MIKLSKRLLDIVNHLNFEETILDVGCDHGKLAIYLIQNSYYKNIYISDNKKSALDSAIKNINKYHLTENISYHLADGIEFIDNLDLDTLIISGLGTKTILSILNNKNLKKIKKMVIQTNNEHYLLRKNIQELGFEIAKETVIKDNKHYYITITFIRGNNLLSEAELEFGIHNNEEYLKNILNYLTNILMKIDKNNPKYSETSTKIDLLKNIIKNKN